MTSSQDPTDAIRRQAMKFPGVTTGTSCNQSTFIVVKVPSCLLVLGQRGKSGGFLVRPGMGLVIDFCQVLKVQVCVHLGGRDIGVPKQFLYGSQVSR